MKRRLTVLIPLLYLIVTGCSLARIEAYPGPDSLPAMGFHFNRYQVDATIKRMPKSILITDHHA